MIKLVRGWFARLTRRPDFGEWALILAMAASTRGECTRRKVGAVILDSRSRVAGVGYNGSYAGGPSCLKGACPRGSSGVPAGSSYDTGPGACHAVHAELNALLDVDDKNRLTDAILYVTAEPCQGCLKILRNTSISDIIYLDDQGDVQYLKHPFGV